VEEQTKAQHHRQPGYQTPQDHGVQMCVNNSQSAALPSKTRWSKPYLRPKQPLFIFLPFTSEGTDQPILVIFFHSPLLSMYKMAFIIFPSMHYSTHSKSSSQLISHTMPRGYKSTVLSQRLHFHKQPHPSHFLSGVLWRILFILYLSCLDCKLFRIRTFCILCPILLETYG